MADFSNSPAELLAQSLAKGYLGVHVEQGVPLLDRDLNLLNDLALAAVRIIASGYIGDGIAAGRDGFEIQAIPADNDLRIMAGPAGGRGMYLVGGVEVAIDAPMLYSDQDGVPALSAPTTQEPDPRTDIVYLDVWLDHVEADEDDGLLNLADVGVQTSVRVRPTWVVRVDQNQSAPPSAAGGHTYTPVARLHRRRSADQITAEMITDLRQRGLSLSDIESRVRTIEYLLARPGFRDAPDAASPFTPVYGLPGTVVDIYGQNLRLGGTPTVRFGSVSATVAALDDTRLRAEVPDMDPGAVTISVTTAGGTAETDDRFVVRAGADRRVTLSTSGSRMPVSNWNPFMPWARVTGTQGLVYETLFLYDPLEEANIPWLAEGGGWETATTYALTIRAGITWSDGQPFTAEDVKLTFELGRELPELSFHPLWDRLGAIAVDSEDERILRFSFSEPPYQQWAHCLYAVPIVPQHIWGAYSAEQILSGANADPIGTGPYRHEGSTTSVQQWRRNRHWWGTGALGLTMAPLRIRHRWSSDPDAASHYLRDGVLALANEFLPPSWPDPDFRTFLPAPAHMLPANTLWLVPNTTRPPLDDAEFRRALAFTADVEYAAQQLYGSWHGWQRANPTGLLPVWQEYVDQEVVEEFGFGFDLDRARQVLGEAEAGYQVHEDGTVRLPSGDQIALSITIPSGEYERIEAANSIAHRLRELGIEIQIVRVDLAHYHAARHSGDFDLLLSYEAPLSNTPWTYYQWMFRQPVTDLMTAGNYGRYVNQQAADLVAELAAVPLGATTGMRAIISQLQRIHLQEMPAIPLWHMPLWATWTEKVWTGWPSVDSDSNHALPSTWDGYWELGAIRMLAALQPKPLDGEG